MVTVHEDVQDTQPPGYDEAVPAPRAGSSTIPGPSPSATPANAQRAQAPLSIIQSNSSIHQDYIVDILNNKSGPDVLLKTTNSGIKSRVYLRGSVPRTVQVRLETTNSSIITTFPDKSHDPDQVVEFNVRTTNARIDLLLPYDFAGIVTVETSNAKIQLSDRVMANSLLVPNEQGSSANKARYRIGKAASSASDKGSTSQAEDECHLRTSNSGIRIGYIDEVGTTSNEQNSGKCVIS